jgi:hypothetical protein
MSLMEWRRLEGPPAGGKWILLLPAAPDETVAPPPALPLVTRTMPPVSAPVSPATAAAPPSVGPNWKEFGAILLITATAWVAYANTLGAPFVFDDAGAILQNASIRQ